MSRAIKLGKVTITDNAARQCRDLAIDTRGLLLRHASGDWGRIDNLERQSNIEAVTMGEPVHSAYHPQGVEVWIITDADRRFTTILLPEDY